MWGIRVVIPKGLQPQVLKSLHANHPGISRMKAIARSHFWWEGLDKEIETWENLANLASLTKPTQLWHLYIPGYGQVHHGRESM